LFLIQFKLSVKNDNKYLELVNKKVILANV